MQHDDNNLTAPMEKANSFNDFFYRSLNPNSYDLPGITSIRNDNLSYIQLSDMDVYNSLINLNSHIMMGPDNIPAIFLKNCAHSLYKSMTFLFNLSLRMGKIPSTWKVANVVPIYKTGCSSQISNYHTVS